MEEGFGPQFGFSVSNVENLPHGPGAEKLTLAKPLVYKTGTNPEFIPPFMVLATQEPKSRRPIDYRTVSASQTSSIHFRPFGSRTASNFWWTAILFYM
jgi:hypothetical protein